MTGPVAWRAVRATEVQRPLNWADGVVVLALVGGLAATAWLGRALWAPLPPEALTRVELSPASLPVYAVRSLFRMFTALAVSVLFSLVVGSWAARSRRAAAVILPVLDVLQSVPVLGFLSATVTVFAALTPGRALGLELASIFAIFTSQVWNLTFAYYHAQVTLPREPAEALRAFGVSGWRRFTHFELPASVIPLVWNGMMSFGGGWFFLAASEAITVLGQEHVLPGLGAFAAVAARERNGWALAWAVAAMVGVIVAVDAVVWRPLVAWAEKFRQEEVASEEPPASVILSMLRRSRLLAWCGRGFARLDDAADRAWRRWRGLPARAAGAGWAGVVANRVLWVLLGLLAARGAVFVLAEVAPREIFRVAARGGLTLMRVTVVVALGALVWTPVGVWIGLSRPVARIVRPVIQVLAAFPANVLFPVVILGLTRWGVTLDWGAVLLMALGSQWYLLFNSIAGAQAIPTELREMAQNLGVRGLARWRALILPAIFPAWVTGALTAAGGAWNASIVAEVVRWGDVTHMATGVGSYVTLATERGDWPRIVLGVGVMSAYVVGLNRLVWRRLERLAAVRYSLAG
jgi:NitT/TauT family transport system permease protein